jgi:NADH-quinone oxidoreductase subunit H
VVFIAIITLCLSLFYSYSSETNRTPFDLPEAEAELVAGYSVEYSGGPFSFYFIAEYCNLIIWSFATSILFLGGWLTLTNMPFLDGFLLFSIKAVIILVLFCCIRAALPRYRWDQLMTLAWSAFLPIVLLGCFFTYGCFTLFVSLN